MCELKLFIHSWKLEELLKFMLVFWEQLKFILVDLCSSNYHNITRYYFILYSELAKSSMSKSQYENILVNIITLQDTTLLLLRDC